MGRARFKSPLAHQCDVARHRKHFEPLWRVFPGLADTAGLVIDGWVEDELADNLAGGGVDDADVGAVDQHQDAGMPWSATACRSAATTTGPVTGWWQVTEMA